MLTAGEVNSGDACHTWVSGSVALALLVARVVADDANDAAAPDHLALVADLLDGRSNFHRRNSTHGIVVSTLLSGERCLNALSHFCRRPDAINASKKPF